jgi:response regulator of citrate/malate metabolism
MDERDFKKLLIDLDLSIAEIGRAVRLSRTGVRKYFRGELRDHARRAQIRSVISRRSRQMRVQLPEFWQDQDA